MSNETELVKGITHIRQLKQALNNLNPTNAQWLVRCLHDEIDAMLSQQLINSEQELKKNG